MSSFIRCGHNHRNFFKVDIELLSSIVDHNGLHIYKYDRECCGTLLFMLVLFSILYNFLLSSFSLFGCCNTLGCFKYFWLVKNLKPSFCRKAWIVPEECQPFSECPPPHTFSLSSSQYLSAQIASPNAV